MNSPTTLADDRRDLRIIWLMLKEYEGQPSVAGEAFKVADAALASLPSNTLAPASSVEAVSDALHDCDPEAIGGLKVARVHALANAAIAALSSSRTQSDVEKLTETLKQMAGAADLGCHIMANETGHVPGFYSYVQKTVNELLDSLSPKVSVGEKGS